MKKRIGVRLSASDDVTLARDAWQREHGSVVISHASARGGSVEVLGVENIDNGEHQRAGREVSIDSERAGVLVPYAALGLGIEVRAVTLVRIGCGSGATCEVLG